ncbi:MAG: tRNA (guanosine(46)-N7)-methyltransferase TrmB [Deltaproteobacteria bacterium]|jgi:tRNA (guanine-N7-)-methyltransferase|nr:tRNA (guanosine(46)-N7)-methyltransferase TrmB [Deltaproteobacteria bacterium]
MTQRTISIESPYFLRVETLEGGLDLPVVFGNNNPLALEIGCGTGHFILERATQQPETNFLAIDIYNKGCWKTCKKLDAKPLSNVRVMRIEARYLLSEGLAPDMLAAIYINCPDPWPKKRHRQRRLVNRSFLQTLWHYLQPDGDFYFSTDFYDYAVEVAEIMARLSGYKNQLANTFAHELPGYPLSKYMQRFQQIGKPLYFIHQRRDPELPRRTLPFPKFQRGFRVRWPKSEHG